MQDTVTLVNNLSDVQAVNLLKQLNQTVYKNIPYNKVVAQLPDQEDVTFIRDLDIESKKQPLDEAASIEATRHVLMSFAQDKQIAPLLETAWEKIKDDDSLLIDVIVAVGLLANLTLFMATTEIEFKVGGLTIKKGTASEGAIKAILSPVSELIKKYSGA